MAKSGEGICKFHFFKSLAMLSCCHFHSPFLTLLLTRLFYTQSRSGTSLAPSHLQIYLRLHQLFLHYMFIPSLIDEVFDRWSRRGILSLSDLYIDGNFASFEQLVQKYHIPKSHFYQYLQLWNFVFSNFKCFPLCPPTCLLDSIFGCKLVRKRTISTIYKILYSHNLTPLDSLKNNWETDLNEPITDDTWHKVIQGIFSSSICLTHVVIQFKIVHQLHWSKVKKTF